jgi:hypothetical protein
MDDDPYDGDSGPVPVHIKTREGWIFYIVTMLIILGIAWALGC